MSCLGEMPYGEYYEQTVKRLVGRRVPLSGTFELTHRCNLRCEHCYLGSARDGPRDELTTDEWIRIIDEIVEEGCLWLLLTGGEPLFREDLPQIYTYARERGLLVTLFTNGTLVTPEVADLFAELPPFRIELTLYGHTRQTYEAVTGVRGSFDRCMRGIELLVERNLPLTLKSMVVATNRHELLDMKAYAEGLGLDFYYDASIHRCLDGDKAPLACRLGIDQMIELDAQDAERVEKWSEVVEYLIENHDQANGGPCGAGQRTFVVGPAGEMYLCLMLRRPSYGLRQGSFREGWYEAFPRMLAKDDVALPPEPCRLCVLRNVCQYCAGLAQIESADPDGWPTFECRMTHERARVLGLL
jgi:radical SAM protein with 4Fe4S-binding SPASM domain